jgi:hypothetical protein
VFAMFHLDYLSCFLTVIATILLARKSWIGLLIAIVNSLIVCAIGLRTSQLGFIPANLFCICAYAFSVRSWLREETHTNRDQAPRQDSGSASDGPRMSPPMQHRTAAGTSHRRRTTAPIKHQSISRERKEASGAQAESQPVRDGNRVEGSECQFVDARGQRVDAVPLLPPAVNRGPIQRSFSYCFIVWHIPCSHYKTRDRGAFRRELTRRVDGCLGDGK